MCYVLVSVTPLVPIMPRVESRGLEAYWVLHWLDLGHLSTALSPLLAFSHT